MIRFVSFWVVLAVSVGTGLSQEVRQQGSAWMVEVGYGPEDLVVDSLNTPPRILISCASRRDMYGDFGEIQAYNPESGSIRNLPRINEPAGLVFRPHGICLTTKDSSRYLYVISHDEEKGSHPVIRYRVEKDRLICEELYESPLLVSPNALQAMADGTLLVSNDAGKRGSMIEKIFRLKRGNIVRYRTGEGWTLAATRLGMPAGLAGSGDQVYVCASLENKLYRYTYQDGQLTGKQKMARIKGGDNIRIYPGFLLTTSHHKPLKFISHVGNPEKKSPTRVVRLDTSSGQTTVLFDDSGSLISAGSVAVLWKNRLVVGQIFEPRILTWNEKK